MLYIRVIFNKLKLIDFQGLRDFEIEFDEKLTKMVGENGSGKTTLLNAIYWLFFDKDSLGSKKFDLFPLDENNELIADTEPTVELDLEIDGVKINLRKTKSRANEFFIDEVPKKATEFKEFISSFISEEMFMTLINPVFFGGKYKWNEQKSIILDNFEVKDTLITKEKYNSIRTDITTFGVDDTKSKFNSKRKKMEDLKTEYGGTKKYILENIKHDKIEESKEDLITKKEIVEKQISEYEKSLSGLYDLKNQLIEVKTKIQNEENKKQNKVSKQKNIIEKKQNEKDVLVKEYQNLSSSLKSIKDTCTLCGSKLDINEVASQKETLQQEIDKTISQGKLLSEEIEVLKLELNRLEKTDSKTISKKEQLEEEIKKLESTANIEKIESLREQLSELRDQISSYDNINKLHNDLKEINEKISKNTSELDDVEITIDLIKQYHKEYSELVADELNSKFENIKIKTFTLQKNGDIKETFEITMGGVPYSSLNSAGKIIAGIELIQLIKDCLDINFPIIIDNKESITRDFNIDNQLITLTVRKGAKLGV